MCQKELVEETFDLLQLKPIFQKDIEKAICSVITGLTFACTLGSIELAEIFRIQVFGGDLNTRSRNDKFFSVVIACLEEGMGDDKNLFEDIRYYTDMRLSLYNHHFLVMSLFETHCPKSTWDVEHLESGPCMDIKDIDIIDTYVNKLESYIENFNNFLYSSSHKKPELTSKSKSSKKKILNFMSKVNIGNKNPDEVQEISDEERTFDERHFETSVPLSNPPKVLNIPPTSPAKGSHSGKKTPKKTSPSPEITSMDDLKEGNL